ncbi:rho GTPase-activating protein 19, partial [Tachysurus ichikawai]
DDTALCAVAGVRGLPSKRSSEEDGTGNQQHTQEALRELFQHVSNMPDSTKKKKLIRQFNKQGTPIRDSPRSSGQKHGRSRSFGGLIKRKVLGNPVSNDRAGSGTSHTKEANKENGSTSVKRTLPSPAQHSSLSL